MSFLRNRLRRSADRQKVIGTQVCPAIVGGGTDARNGFRAMPELSGPQPGFKEILSRLKTGHDFTFCKLNHGFWERLARLERLGVPREQITGRSGEELDRLLGIPGTHFAEGGLLAELLSSLQGLPPPDDRLFVVPSLSPWPLSDRVEGTPLESRDQCEELIAWAVPETHLARIQALGFTGHELKAAVITGDIALLGQALKGRHLIYIGPAANRSWLEGLAAAHLEEVPVHPTQARSDRFSIRDNLCAAIERSNRAGHRPVVIASAGGAMTTWLGIHASATFGHLQFIDFGGALAAFDPQAAARMNWTRAWQRQLTRTLPAVAPFEQNSPTHVGIRDPGLIALAQEAGVPGPASADELPGLMPRRPLPFIENKIYDHRRMTELLSLSVAANHHANGGPVTALLERAVERVAGLPHHRRVVAVSSGTAALHLACGMRAREGTEARGLRWVASAMNFFSCAIGPLAGTRILDCAPNGRFDLEALRALPLSAYDGVIYTNVFGQQSDWDAVADFCRSNGKHFVVDNATGLLDRPASAQVAGRAPLEAISAHHTKPWGVGEGGFVICDRAEEGCIRDLANFAARLHPSANPQAGNYKMSDLAAAAILDRLERMFYWARFYRWQERRMKSLVIDAGLNVTPFPGVAQVRSPRAHTAFLAAHAVDPAFAPGPLTIRKYYRPLRGGQAEQAPTPNAEQLYSRIFCLSNAPEMRLVENQEIISQIRDLVRNGTSEGEGGRA